MSVTKEKFGTGRNGEEISLFTITNGDMEVAVTDLGANIVKVIVPNKDGIKRDVVLGYDTAEEYYDNGSFFGACIGRSGNRIKDAKFTIDGVEYQLAVNDGPNNLHSDMDNGFHKKTWKAEILDNAVAFSYESPDMENGFPGNMSIKVTYTVTADKELVIEYAGVSDKKTLFNMTNHSYFNLAGHDAGREAMENTMLTLNASNYTPIVPGAIPTGEIKAVAGSVFDFTSAKRIGDEVDADEEQLTMVQGYDHNFVLDNYDGTTVRKIGEATADNLTMEVYSDLPGVQFYAGNCISDCTGKGGVEYKKRYAFCLETQYYPNSINQEGFVKPIVEAGKPFKTITSYKFV